MVRIIKKSGNRLEGIGERIDVRLTLLEEALGMTPGDPEIYGNWIASKAPEPEVGEEEVGVIEGMDAVEDATTCFPRTEDGVPFCWDYQIKGFFKDACSALAASETVPAGTVLEFSILVMNPKDAETVREWLDYGALRGLFQWRNSGKGRFEWEEVAKED